MLNNTTEYYREIVPFEMAPKKKWIQEAMNPSNKGMLHKALGVKPGQPIPKAKLAAAAKRKDAIGTRVRLAQTLSGFSKGKRGPAKKK
jgi:hypothetical protein